MEVLEMNLTVCTDEINRSSMIGPTSTGPVVGAINGLNVHLSDVLSNILT